MATSHYLADQINAGMVKEIMEKETTESERQEINADYLLAQLVSAVNDNTGHEPSLSIFYRALDEAKQYLKEKNCTNL